MACKRPGVRVPLAPHFPRSKPCCDLENTRLSSCNSASYRGFRSLCDLKSVQVKSYRTAEDTAELPIAPLDSQTGSHSVIRATPVRLVAILFDVTMPRHFRRF